MIWFTSLYLCPKAGGAEDFEGVYLEFAAGGELWKQSKDDRGSDLGIR